MFFNGFKAVMVAVASAGVLAACSAEAPPEFNSTDMTGADYARGFELTDHHGEVRTLEDFEGQVVTVFFGFTQCPDICPSTMLMMSDVMERLGDDAEDVQVLFITVDPERDTQELLADYVPVFDERFLGLRGDEEQTQEVADEFRIFYSKSGDTNGMNYTVDHSTGTYVFDREGRIRLYVRHTEDPENVAEDLSLLLADH